MSTYRPVEIIVNLYEGWDIRFSGMLCSLDWFKHILYYSMFHDVRWSMMNALERYMNVWTKDTKILREVTYQTHIIWRLEESEWRVSHLGRSPPGKGPPIAIELKVHGSHKNNNNILRIAIYLNEVTTI